MKLYEEIIEKLLSEVDPDIRDILLKTEQTYYGEGTDSRKANLYKGYELLDNPILSILKWQELRDKKINFINVTRS